MYKYYQKVIKKFQNFNYKPLKSPTDVSHSQPSPLPISNTVAYENLDA